MNQLQFGLGHADMIRQEFHVNMNDAASIDHDGGTLAYTRLKHMTIQAWSPFQYGFFEGTFIDNPKFPELNDSRVRISRWTARNGTTCISPPVTICRSACCVAVRRD